MGNDFTVVPAAECADIDKPVAVQECEMRECQPQWFTTEWSTVRDERTGRVKIFLRAHDSHSVSVFLSSVLTFLWEGRTDERGPLSHTR